MDLYTFSVALGGAGLGIMALSGLGHALSHGGFHGAGSGSHGHAAGPGHSAAHGHAHAGAHAHGAGGASHAHSTSGHLVAPRDVLRAPMIQRAWVLLSPRVVFSAFLGFGATGLAARSLSEGPRFLVAALGAVVLDRFVVTPLWNFYMRFGSEPALSLEGSIGDEARAVTNFDESGQGLVSLELDGRLVQLLGSLRPEDRRAGIRVRAGDAVWIDDVDGTRNRCTVRTVPA